MKADISRAAVAGCVSAVVSSRGSPKRLFLIGIEAHLNPKQGYRTFLRVAAILANLGVEQDLCASEQARSGIHPT
jgi:hypothetical protein